MENGFLNDLLSNAFIYIFFQRVLKFIYVYLMVVSVFLDGFGVV